jgi:hypothetical protein
MSKEQKPWIIIIIIIIIILLLLLLKITIIKPQNWSKWQINII